MIDRDSPISIYYQIAVDLRNRIARGEWQERGRLPAEVDLAKEYEVSRMTVRQALAYLENEGVVLRKRGTGTLIKLDPKQVSSGANFPISFSRQMRELGFSPTVKLIQAEIMPNPTADIFSNLGLTGGDEIVSFKRLFSLNDQPVALIQSTLPHQLCPNILETELVNDSLTTTLEKSYGLYPVQVDQRVSAALLTQENAELLAAEMGTAVIEIHTQSSKEDGTVIEYAQTICVGDRLSLHLHVSTSGESSETQFEYIANTVAPQQK